MKRIALPLLVLAAVAMLGAAPPPAAPKPSPADALLAALKAAPGPQEAGRLEAKLLAYWHDRASPSVQLLIDHAAQAGSAGKMEAARDDADAAITLQPDCADLWRRRAELRFALEDDRGAFADLAQALTREPRLIPAWSDISRFAEVRHDPKRALAAWRKVLELDPMTEGAAKRTERLQHLINGEPI